MSILSGLNYFLPALLIQKIILFFIFFCAGRFAFAYLPLPNNKTAKYFAALIYTVNPFVYGRFLAGHWTILAAYALLPIFINYFLRFISAPQFFSASKLFLIIFVVGIFSPHFFVMAILIFVVGVVARLFMLSVKKDFSAFAPLAKYFSLCLAFIFIASSYWLLPAISNRASVLQTFSDKHWLAFAPTGRGATPVWLSLAAFGGFWAEGQPWARDFVWPADAPMFRAAFYVIALFAALGIFFGLRERATRCRTLFFCVLGIFAYVFAAGAGETVFKILNVWLYEHIFFWRGFRDSQKFIAWLALCAAVFAGSGAAVALDFFERFGKIVKILFCSVLCVIVFFYGFFLWDGFHRQLRAVWYPSSWNLAKNIIDRDNGDYKVLILPWHGYFSLKFNDDHLTANPAAAFFGDRSVVSHSVELEGVYDQATDAGYLALDEAITNNSQVSVRLTEQKIKYIIYFSDLGDDDDLHYEFLSLPEFRKIYENNELSVYNLPPE